MGDDSDKQRADLERAKALIDPLVCAELWHEVIAAQHAIRAVCGKEAADLAEVYALRWVRWYAFFYGHKSPDTLNKLTDYIEP
jgi:hypothetical protein